MRLLYAILALAVYLGLQVAVGRFAPGLLAYADLMLVPVAWYGLRGGQQGAMLVGCAAGLLEDAWFQTGVLGFNGFKKTLLGWVLGELGARFDLNFRVWQLLGGGLLSVADHYLGFGLLRLLGQRAEVPDPFLVGMRAAVMALIVCLVFVMFDRAKVRQAAAARPRARRVGRVL